MTAKTGTRSWAAAAAIAASASFLAAQEFEAPVRLEVDGKPITTEIGHAAPYIYDFDRDGVRDLLVGQFGQGRLRIYRNTGTNAKPVYAEHEWFMAGGDIATVPAG